MGESEDAKRLEELWAGEFGDDYVARNDEYAARNAELQRGRMPFWQARVEALQPANVLEIGCNVGGNLRWIAELVGAEHVAGIDVNEGALQTAREHLPAADLRRAPARDLPFADASFDLVFTTGVLIHQPPSELPTVMDEIVRVSRRHVLCGEYQAPDIEEVPYRGQEGALYRADYGRMYQERHPELTLVDQGFLPKGDGPWDDLTWWVFEKPAG